MKILTMLKQNFLLFCYNSSLILGIIVIDQFSKWYFIDYFSHTNEYIEVTSFLKLTYSWNYGISFGLFSNYYHYSNIIFVIINTIVTGYLWLLLYKSKSKLSFWGYSCLVGGAIGNIIDRLYRGAVFDFICVYLKAYNFPIFNLADSFISLGVILILYEYYKQKNLLNKTI